MANGVPHAAGAAFRYHYGGGGGWGDPLERDPEAVLDDVSTSTCRSASAERDYGVVFTRQPRGRTLAVDAEATKRLRERKRPQA